MLVSQMSFCGETIGGITKCHLPKCLAFFCLFVFEVFAFGNSSFVSRLLALFFGTIPKKNNYMYFSESDNLTRPED